MDVLQLPTAIGVIGDELACDGTDVAQTRDLRGKIKPTIRLENILLKRKHIRFHSTYKHLFFKQSWINRVRKGYNLAISFAGLYGYVNWC